MSLPNAALVVLNRLEDADGSVAAMLHRLGLSRSRLLLVGFGAGGQHALSLALTTAECCAGLLAYGISPELGAQPRPVGGHVKVRLIGDRTGELDERLSAVIRRLVAFGIDARGMQLSGTGLTRPATRLGAAYLAELSASALMTGSTRSHSTETPACPGARGS
jgi:pimeloyl-ACP methyl ester carboxylesterase